jgi:flavodoxin
MTRVLVAYYSWTGHTRRVAESVAAACDAELEPIEDAGPRTMFRSLVQAMLRRPAPIRLPRQDAAAHDVVILGAPVWVGGVAAPMRSYIAAQRGAFKAIACFATAGGQDGAKVARQMAALAGKPAAAIMGLRQQDIEAGRCDAAIQAFAEAVMRQCKSVH